MDFRDNPEEAAFRKEVRDFIKNEISSSVKETDLAETGMYRGAFERLKDVRQKLAKRGWIAPAWPKEYGGAGLSVKEQFIMNEEFAENRVPPVGGMGVSMVGPTLIVHGNEEQKKEHLGRILNGEVQWCQGFSEPGSGSDLASLQTRAVRDGDDFVINGQKIWTSGAQFAHWMFMMARTDPDAPKHKGISYFLVDMKSPGITVRPLTNLANQNMFNEVFFEDVRVPARNLVGELNRGWYIGTTTLDFERSSIGSAVGIRLQLDQLVKYAREHEGDGTSRTGYLPSVKMELADRYVEANVAKLMSYRVVTMQAKGMIPNHEASMTKLFASELNQRIARTGIKVLGLYGQLYGDAAPLKGRYESSYMTSLASTIAGGTSEIQRNIIATRGLGLPRD
ncbi:MAG TPA: acyl-CoA dehydrogenase family protein [Dehalococcoidia bacterium]|jgi:alkylation response protein AidB-like acyl-CoA dehydrogenase|nr:acyl-CoA dehydrogenase family protein [Dehalococcoidia bacterium]